MGTTQVGPEAFPRRARALLLSYGHPSEASSSSRLHSGGLQLNAGELPASAARRASFPISSRTRRPPLHPLSSSLASATTGTADSRLGRANAGRPRRVERELSNAKAFGAHRDFNRARSGRGKARSEAGHGGASTAAFQPGLEKNGSDGGLWWVSACARGRNRLRRTWRSWERELGGEEATTTVKFYGAERLSELGEKKKTRRPLRGITEEKG